MLLLSVAIATGLATTVVSAAALPACRVADVTTAHRSYTDWARTILDTTYRLTSAYGPSDLRSTADAGLNGGQRVRALVITDLRAMARAARAAGARLAVESSYRSYSTQASTFAYWVRVSGYAAALRSSARAGHSEHQLGTTLDFKSYGGSAPWNYADWGRSKAGTWLRNNAWRYGFVMSYPKGKTSVTCYAYEPWHFRYVGRAVAAKIHASGLTPREYLWRQQTAPVPSPTPKPSPTRIPGAESTPIALPTPMTEPTPVTEPTPLVQAGPVTEPTPSVEPAPPEPTPVGDPTPTT